MNPNWTKQQQAEAMQKTLAGGIPRDKEGNPRNREIFDGIYLTLDMLEDAKQGRRVFHSRGLTASELKGLIGAIERGEKAQSPAGIPGFDCVFVRGDRSVNQMNLTGTLEGVRYLWRDGADNQKGFFEMELEVLVKIKRSSFGTAGAKGAL